MQLLTIGKFFKTISLVTHLAVYPSRSIPQRPVEGRHVPVKRVGQGGRTPRWAPWVELGLVQISVLRGLAGFRMFMLRFTL